ncbi:hypothetical protein [Colwellia piezophila]|uniref:hypothetical protein n=1 Tax=Colwellia piezophila TaxID=211668 RepID=UPI00035E24D8|nr:hypothetical protein [Colwellia piezophila]
MSNFKIVLEKGQTEAEIKADLQFELKNELGECISSHQFDYLPQAIAFMEINQGLIKQETIPNTDKSLFLTPSNTPARLILNDFWLRLLYTRKLDASYYESHL